MKVKLITTMIILGLSTATFAQIIEIKTPSALKDAVVVAHESSQGEKEEQGSRDDQQKESGSRDEQ